MPTINVFHTLAEENKPAAERVHHCHTECPAAAAIPESMRRPGTGMYRLCRVCNKLAQAERAAREGALG